MKAPAYAPRLPKPLPLLAPVALERGAELSGGLLAEADFSGLEAADLLFEAVLARGVLFTGTRFSNPRLFDVRLERCDLSGADWEKARFRRIEWQDCRLLGAVLLECTAAETQDFASLRMRGCGAEGAVFAGSALPAARFESCDLRRASFEGADLRSAVFSRCNLSGADLRHAKLAGADFRSSTLDGLQVEPQDLRGAVFDPTQALQVAGLLGIVIEAEEVDT